MRSFLAAALVVAAALPTAAHADAGSCLDPLLSSSMPQFVYYNPEIGGYYVDVDAAQSWAAAQPGRALAVADCLRDGLPATNGCVTQFLTSPYPNTHVVTIDDQQRVTIDPHGADAFALALVGNTLALVACTV